MSVLRDIEDYLSPEGIRCGWNDETLLCLVMDFLVTQPLEVKEALSTYLHNVAVDELREGEEL